jgi:prolipoprotein diacylglyceryltransferase
MKISVLDPASFRLFYLFAFSLILVVFCVLALRRKLPMRSVLLILTTTTLFTVAGSRLFTIPFQEWFGLMSTGSIEGHSGRSGTGGLLFGVLGFILAVRFFKMDSFFVPVYAWLTPVGFALQKIGCFLNGCCYGTPSGLPWSVQYPVFTNAHHHQWTQGLIGDPAALSAGLHPVQLYESALLIIVSIIVFRTRKLWRREWSIMFFSLALLFTTRLTTSLFRDTSSINFLNNDLHGMIMFRLLMAGLIILSCSFLFINERKLMLFRPRVSAPQPSGILIYAFLLASSVFLLRGLFSQFEMAAVAIKFIPAMILTGIYLFRNIRVVSQRIIATSSVAVPVILVFQSFPQDTTKQSHPIRDFYSKNTSFHRIDIGLMGGSNQSVVAYNPQEGECGTTYTENDYRYRFLMTGLGYSHVKRENHNSTEFGLNLAIGSNTEKNLTTSVEQKFTIFSINPYGRLDSRWIGIGLGLDLGNLRWIPVVPIDQSSFNHGTRESPILPAFSFRVGRSDYVDGRYNYGLQRMTTLPVLTHEITIGSGFGNPYDYSLRLGVGVGQDKTFAIISTEALVHQHFGINLKLNMSFDGTNSFWGAFGMSYRFGFRRI